MITYQGGVFRRVPARYKQVGGDSMWFWIIAGLILLTIVSNAAKEAREEQRDKRKEEKLDEIAEKLDEDEQDFVDELREK